MHEQPEPKTISRYETLLAAIHTPSRITLSIFGRAIEFLERIRVGDELSLSLLDEILGNKLPDADLDEIFYVCSDVDIFLINGDRAKQLNTLIEFELETDVSDEDFQHAIDDFIRYEESILKSIISILKYMPYE